MEHAEKGTRLESIPHAFQVALIIQKIIALLERAEKGTRLEYQITHTLKIALPIQRESWRFRACREGYETRINTTCL